MNERLTDEQIEKADKKIRALARLFLSGEIARDEQDRIKNGKDILFIGTTTMRQFIRVINDLRHYKKLAEERGAALEWYADPNTYTESLEPYQCPFTKQTFIRYQTIDAVIKIDQGERARQTLGKEPRP